MRDVQPFTPDPLFQAMAVMEEKGGRTKTGEEPILEIIEGMCDAKEVPRSGFRVEG